MNIDTVETQTSESKVDAADADEILGTNGKEATLSSYMWHIMQENGVYKYPTENILATKDALDPNQFYELKTQDGIQRRVQNPITDSKTGETSVQESIETVTETRVALTRWGVDNMQFPMFVNTSEYQKSTEMNKAVYKTTFGSDHRMAATSNGVCGEAWWFFKLAEDFSEGYALCFDNHGTTGCGVFAREWGEVFLTHYKADGKGINIPEEYPNANVEVLGKCGIGRWENDPRYDIEVVEESGKFTVTITPDDLNLSTFYDGESHEDAPLFTSYTHGNRVDHASSSLTQDPLDNDVSVQWEGATKDPIVFSDVKISPALLEKNTTQAFQSYKFLGTYFANNSVDVTRTVVKSFGDIVYEPEWTDGALGLTSGLAEDAAEILERDYDIDAGEVLSMNIDTVETITGGIDAQTPDFAEVVNSWEQIGQRTWTAAMEGDQGYVYSKVQASPNETTSTMWNYAGNNATRDMPYGWWGTGLLNPDEYDADNIHAKFTVLQAGSLANGFCFNVTKNMDDLYYPVDQVGNRKSSTPVPTINGYFFNVSHHGNSTVHRLFKVKNWRLDNSFSAECGRIEGTETYDQAYNTTNGRVYRNGYMTGNTMIWCGMNLLGGIGETRTSWRGEEFTKLAEWVTEPNCDSNRWELVEGDAEITYEVECKDGEIKIWDNSKSGAAADESTRRKLRDDGGSPVVSVKDDTFTKGTYGFWGNNCEQKGQSRFANLSVEINKTFVKSFGDIVYEPEWTDGALHMLINMDTKADSTMLGSDGGLRI